MRKEEFREELLRWVDRVMDLRDRLEYMPISEALSEEHYLIYDMRSLLFKGLRREK